MQHSQSIAKLNQMQKIDEKIIAMQSMMQKRLHKLRRANQIEFDQKEHKQQLEPSLFKTESQAQKIQRICDKYENQTSNKQVKLVWSEEQGQKLD